MCLGNRAFEGAAGKIKLMILAGEALTNNLRDSLRKTGCEKIVNLYGPSEAAVYVTQADVTSGPVTIGRPLCNCRAYVLNGHLRPALPTARGELYLAGECLSTGYIGNEELTKESFLPDPFFPEMCIRDRPSSTPAGTFYRWSSTFPGEWRFHSSGRNRFWEKCGKS